MRRVGAHVEQVDFRTMLDRDEETMFFEEAKYMDRCGHSNSAR